jgi:DNA-binding MarR family transcriptional regulator
MTTVGQPVTGQDINMAARAARTALDVVLAEQGTSFPPLAMLNTIVSRGNAMDRDALIAQLASGLVVNAETVLIVLHGLETRGLVRTIGDETPRVELTPAGNAEHGRLTSIVGELTRALYAGFDAEDLAVTRRVLVTLTDRADAHVATTIRSSSAGG